MGKVRIGAAGALVLLLAVATAHAQRAKQPSISFQLASLDCRCVPSTATVKKYQRLLSYLATRKCKDTPRHLGDMAVVSRRLLREKGVKLTNFQVLQLVNKSIPNNIGFKQPCADIFAALVTLIGKR